MASASSITHRSSLQRRVGASPAVAPVSPWAFVPFAKLVSLIAIVSFVSALMGLPTIASAEEASAPKNPTPVAVAEGSDAAADSWYAVSVARTEERTLMTHYWSKGRKLRAESTFGGQRIVSIVNGKWYYTLDPVKGTGTRIERSAQAISDDEKGGRPFGHEFDEIKASGAEVVGSETVGPVELEIYQLTNTAGRRRVWVAKTGARVPYRIETYDRRSAKDNVVDYTHWLKGLAISDVFFSPDPQIVLKELSYDEYQAATGQQSRGPVPVLFHKLLHGERTR